MNETEYRDFLAHATDTMAAIKANRRQTKSRPFLPHARKDLESFIQDLSIVDRKGTKEAAVAAILYMFNMRDFDTYQRFSNHIDNSTIKFKPIMDFAQALAIRNELVRFCYREDAPPGEQLSGSIKELLIDVCRDAVADLLRPEGGQEGKDAGWLCRHVYGFRGLDIYKNNLQFELLFMAAVLANTLLDSTKVIILNSTDELVIKYDYPQQTTYITYPQTDTYITLEIKPGMQRAIHVKTSGRIHSAAIDDPISFNKKDRLIIACREDKTMVRCMRGGNTANVVSLTDSGDGENGPETHASTARIQGPCALTLRHCSCGKGKCADQHFLDKWLPNKKISLSQFVKSAIKGTKPGRTNKADNDTGPSIKTNTFTEGMFFGCRDGLHAELRHLSKELTLLIQCGHRDPDQVCNKNALWDLYSQTPCPASHVLDLTRDLVFARDSIILRQSGGQEFWYQETKKIHACKKRGERKKSKKCTAVMLWTETIGPYCKHRISDRPLRVWVRSGGAHLMALDLLSETGSGKQ